MMNVASLTLIYFCDSERDLSVDLYHPSEASLKSACKEFNVKYKHVRKLIDQLVPSGTHSLYIDVPVYRQGRLKQSKKYQAGYAQGVLDEQEAATKREPTDVQIDKILDVLENWRNGEVIQRQA